MGAKVGVREMIRHEGQLKVVRLVNRRPGTDVAHFRQHWLSHHRDLEREIVETTPVLRIATTFPSLAGRVRERTSHDGMVEIYFATRRDLVELFAGPIPAMMRRDEERFVDLEAPVLRVLAEESEIGSSNLG